VDPDGLSRLVAELRSAGSDTHSVEVKSAVGKLPKSLCETLSAFSNGAGGTVVLGLDEGTGFRPAPGFDAVKTLEALARACADDVHPPVRSEIEILPFEGSHVVVAHVPEISPLNKPAYVRGRGEYQGSFIRGGDGDRKLSDYEVGLLHANRGQPRDDREPVGGASAADLDDDAVAALLRRMRRRQPRAFRSVPDDVALRRLGVLVSVGPDADGLVPSLAGLLTLGAYPQEFFPQLNVTFVVLPSDQAGVVPEGGPRFIDNRSLNGPIPWIVSDAVDAIARNMRVAGTVRGVGRQDAYEYPVEALREAVVNAIMHRDYSPPSRGAQVQVEMYPSRLVVRNPGGLFGPVAEGELGTEGVTSSRNPALSALLQEVQLPDSDRVICENRGTGIPTMLEQLRRSGTASVKFSNAISHFTVTFTRTELQEASGTVTAPGVGEARPAGNLTGRPAEILGLFTGEEELSAADIARATDLSKAMTTRHLARLVAEGRLIATAPPASRNRAYRLPPGQGAARPLFRAVSLSAFRPVCLPHRNLRPPRKAQVAARVNLPVGAQTEYVHSS
jgi:ATP-dependent DNA helicase RecG